MKKISIIVLLMAACVTMLVTSSYAEHVAFQTTDWGNTIEYTAAAHTESGFEASAFKIWYSVDVLTQEWTVRWNYAGNAYAKFHDFTLTIPNGVKTAKDADWTFDSPLWDQYFYAGGVAVCHIQLKAQFVDGNLWNTLYADWTGDFEQNGIPGAPLQPVPEIPAGAVIPLLSLVGVGMIWLRKKAGK
jgi:hypothetical protein